MSSEIFSFRDLNQGGLVQTSSAEMVMTVDLRRTPVSFLQSIKSC